MYNLMETRVLNRRRKHSEGHTADLVIVWIDGSQQRNCAQNGRKINSLCQETPSVRAVMCDAGTAPRKEAAWRSPVRVLRVPPVEGTTIGRRGTLWALPATQSLLETTPPAQPPCAPGCTHGVF